MYMKNISLFNLSAIAALLLSAGSALAAGPTATLQVKGTINPAACTPTLANGGIVDMGTTSTSEITGTYQFPSKTISLDITCTGLTKMNMAITDNRTDSLVTGLTHYPARTALGLGKTTDDKAIGAYVIGLNNAVIDGEAARVIWTANLDNASWDIILPEHALRVNNNYGEASILSFAAATGTLAPVAFEHATADLVLHEAFLSGEMKDATEIQNLDGNATLDFDYM
jgi:type 1 fimbria pilin